MVLEFYANPDDLHIVVRKKVSRSAWTLNMGNWRLWVVVGALILAAVLLTMLLQYAA